MSGKGSQARRAELVAGLFAAATETEQTFLLRLLGGELRQGALAGIMADAVAKAAGIPAAAVQRAAMLGGDLPAVAAAAPVRRDARRWTRSPCGWAGRSARCWHRPPRGVADALERHGGTAIFEAKLDGARVQIHRSGDEVTVYTRSLDDVTARLPEVVEATLALPVRELIADGEAIALRPDNRPHRFQVTASRFGRSVDVAGSRCGTTTFGVLLRHPAPRRRRPARRADHRAAGRPGRAGAGARTGWTGWPRPTLRQAADFLDATLAAGHEGVMAKSPAAPYQAGRRGAGWLKVKPVHTLDLVVLAVEWGSGRRRGKLSNIHLGARDPVTGEFIMVGKTFKGMTDAMLDWQTARFTRTRRRRHGRLRGARAPRAGGRDRVGRGAEIDALPRRAGAAVRPGGRATATTRARPKPTPSTPCARCTRRLAAASGVVGFDRDCARRRRQLHPHRRRPATRRDHRPLPHHRPAQDHLRRSSP